MVDVIRRVHQTIGRDQLVSYGRIRAPGPRALAAFDGVICSSSSMVAMNGPQSFCSSMHQIMHFIIVITLMLYQPLYVICDTLPISATSYEAWAIAERFTTTWLPLDNCIVTDQCCCHNSKLGTVQCSSSVATVASRWSLTNTTRIQSSYSLLGLYSYGDISDDHQQLTVTSNANACVSRLALPVTPVISSSSSSSSSSSTGTSSSSGDTSSTSSDSSSSSSSSSNTGDILVSSSTATISSSSSSTATSRVSSSSSSGTRSSSSSSSSTGGGLAIVSLLDGQYAFAGSDCTPNAVCACGTGTWTISTSSSSDNSDNALMGVDNDILHVEGSMFGGWGSSPSLMLKTLFDEPLTIINATLATFKFVDQQFLLHAIDVPTNYYTTTSITPTATLSLASSPTSSALVSLRGQRFMFAPTSLTGCNSVALRVDNSSSSSLVYQSWQSWLLWCTWLPSLMAPIVMAAHHRTLHHHPSARICH